MHFDLSLFLTGSAMGIGAGLTPGPISMLILRETLTTGWKNGVKIAFTPAITDLPIVIFTVALFSRLGGVNWMLSLISFCGAAFLIRLGIKNFKAAKKRTAEDSACKIPDFRMKEALVAGILNPQPYLFWLTVGAPIVLAGLKIHPLNGILFVVGVYGAMVMTNLGLAMIVSRSSKFLGGRTYAWLLKGSALALFFFAVMFAKEGLQRFY